ncbi:hypothetical protein H2203_009184 [Taxawa tesnikishii (nom. ined.)]|nr:hypothetical protein H2203_009184 [Dothideales sp. JES 119]
MSSISLSATMGKILTKYTQEEIAEIVAGVFNMQPETAAAAVQPAVAVAAGATSQRKKRSKKTTTSKTANSIAPSRPLNAWMAFRTYLAPIFKSFQQKDISGLMTILWQNDPFKAKWSIVAKGYSMIREHHTKDAAPLDVFLVIVCPHIGLVDRQEYLSIMGWEVVGENGAKKLERRYEPDIALFPECYLTTNLSAEDVVAFCYHANYVQDGGAITRNRNDAATLTMAAQPTPVAVPQQAQDIAAQADGNAWIDDFMTNWSVPAAPRPYSAAPLAQPSADTDDSELARALKEVLAENNTEDFGILGAGTGQRCQTVQALDQSGFQYPYNEEFSPLNTSTLSFDPYMGNGRLSESVSAPEMGNYATAGNNLTADDFDLNNFLNHDIFDLNTAGQR